MDISRACLVATVASIFAVMAASPSWAKSRSSNAGREAAIQKCVAQIQAEFGGPRHTPDEDARTRFNQYASCMTSAGYRP
jgi:hypothetical protein